MTRHETFPAGPGRRPPYHGRLEPAESATLSTSTRGPVRFGATLLIVFLLGFGAWALLAPLSGGAVAPGIISPDGNRKVVQHLEGGIIRKLLVRDGDSVSAGQPLVVLEDTQPRSSHDMLLNQQRTLVAAQSRLEAEGFQRAAIVFPQELQSTDAKARAITEAQERIFTARQDLEKVRRRVLGQRIEQLKEQIKGYEAQVESWSS
jgi:HlyD family secretion protein/epimerase transport system membrane fusion protein